MTQLLHDIRELLRAEIPVLPGIRVERVCLGLGYSGVKLESGHTGVCNSLLSEAMPDCCQILQDAGTLAGRPAEALMDLVESWDIIKRVIGVSTINALSQVVLEAEPDRYLAEKKPHRRHGGGPRGHSGHGGTHQALREGLQGQGGQHPRGAPTERKACSRTPPTRP